MSEEVWEVVGGGDKGGILVRTGKDTKSAEESERLSTGASVRQLALEDGRLHYELLSGTGPGSGWVSVSLKGKDLLVLTEKRPAAAAASSAAASPAAVPAQASAPREGDYYVTLGVVYKKTGADPATGKMVKLNRKVGAIVHTTGKIWKGAAGGFWVELDVSAGDSGAGEKAGYVMIDAAGFGTPGPCLQKVNADDGEPLLLHATQPEGGKAWDGGSVEKVFLVLQKTSILEVRVVISMLFGLEQGGISVLGVSGALGDETTIKDAGFKTGAEVKFEYKGAKSMTLIVMSPLEESAGTKLLDLPIKENWTVGQVAKLIADRTGLKKNSMIMAKGKMGERVPESAKMDESKPIVDYGLSDGDEVAFMYLGNLEGDLEAFMKSK